MQSTLVTLWLLCIPFCLGSRSGENVCGLDDCTVLLQLNHAGVKHRQAANEAAIDRDIFFMREQDMTLADSIQELTKRLPPGDTKELFQSFSICGNCETWQRFGENHDGGYLSCMDNMKNGNLFAEMNTSNVRLNFVARVFQLEALREEHLNHGQLLWLTTVSHGWDVSSAKFQDVESARAKCVDEDGHWSEWMASAGQHKYRNLEEISTLDHRISWARFWRPTCRVCVSVMHRLLRDGGFQVVHLHGTNCCPAYEKEGFKIPVVIELTLDALANQLTSCQDPKDLELDKPNNPNGVDIGPWHTEKWKKPPFWSLRRKEKIKGKKPFKMMEGKTLDLSFAEVCGGDVHQTLTSGPLFWVPRGFKAFWCHQLSTLFLFKS